VSTSNTAEQAALAAFADPARNGVTVDFEWLRCGEGACGDLGPVPPLPSRGYWKASIITEDHSRHGIDGQACDEESSEPVPTREAVPHGRPSLVDRAHRTDVKTDDISALIRLQVASTSGGAT
jgi:hypothetical protein